MIFVNKVIIVEGKTDRNQLKRVLKEPVEIITTYGTIGREKLDELVDSVEGREIYILVDADEAGEKLRKQLIQELPTAIHLEVPRKYRQVAETPLFYLARILSDAYFDVYSFQ
jgi:toprim domain protein